MTQNHKEFQDKAEGAALVAGGTAAGAGVAATVGGMGLVGGFGGVAIGAAPVVAAGAVVGSAAYGAKKAIEEGDATALGAVAAGAAAGSIVAGAVGNMGLALGGKAIAIGAAPVVAAGAVVGLAAYGIAKMLDESGTCETSAQVFERMEEKVLQMEAYSSAIMELEAFLEGKDLQQKFIALEIEDELEALKVQMQTGINLSND